MNTNANKIEQLATEFGNDTLKIAAELKRVQSIKCRLKKCKGKSTYDKEMTKVLTYEQELKEARALIEPRHKPTTLFTQEDVDKLDYDQTVKAIRSIQSKKTLSKWLTTVEGDNDEFRNACKIEAMLLEHRKHVEPLEPDHVRKTEIQTIIDTIQDSGELSQDKILALLSDLLK